MSSLQPTLSLPNFDVTVTTPRGIAEVCILSWSLAVLSTCSPRPCSSISACSTGHWLSEVTQRGFSLWFQRPKFSTHGTACCKWKRGRVRKWEILGLFCVQLNSITTVTSQMRIQEKAIWKKFVFGFYSIKNQKLIFFKKYFRSLFLSVWGIKWVPNQKCFIQLCGYALKDVFCCPAVCKTDREAILRLCVRSC